MKIEVQRTRIIFSEYTPDEKIKIDDMVGTIDKVFSYEDPDKHIICVPTGLLKEVQEMFPYVPIKNTSNITWSAINITPVEHDAKPRNELQTTFIKFLLENTKKTGKVAGILSTGTGKGQPMSELIPTPLGWTEMWRLEVGSLVYNRHMKPTRVTAIYPQGVERVYKFFFEGGRTARCDMNHLWPVVSRVSKTGYDVRSTYHIIQNYRERPYKIITMDQDRYNELEIIDIMEDGEEECQCITVEDEEGLYLTDQMIVTHNTFMACYSAIALGLRTLIVTPTSSIKEQWADTLIKMFHVDPSNVLLLDSPRKMMNVNADFVIASQASLASLNKRYDLESILKDDQFGTKVIDEVQMWFHNIIKIDGNSNIQNNWYLTGTFGRSGDEENNLYQRMFSDLCIFREKQKKPTILNRKPGNIYGMKPYINCKMIWTNSGLSKEEIAKVSNSIRYSERAGKWMRYGLSVPAYMELVIPSDGSMTPFLKTTLEVIKEADRTVTYGRMLVLGSTIASAEVIKSYLVKMFPQYKIGTIHSHNTKEENTKARETYDIVVSTTQSCGTGFDMKGLGKLIVVAQYASWILCDQVSGRLRRRNDEKDCYMWDVADSCCKQLRAWANRRADVLREKCKTFKVVSK